MITKTRLKAYIEQLPETVSLEEIIEHLILVDKLEQRIQASDRGQLVDEDDIKKEMEQWFE